MSWAFSFCREHLVFCFRRSPKLNRDATMDARKLELVGRHSPCDESMEVTLKVLFTISFLQLSPHHIIAEHDQTDLGSRGSSVHDGTLSCSDQSRRRDMASGAVGS